MSLLRLLPAVSLIRMSLTLMRLAQRCPHLAGSARTGSRVALALARSLQGNSPDPGKTSQP